MAEAAGHSQATLEAKRRDLQRFLSFYQNLYKHDRPEEWFVSVTKAFLKALQKEAGLDRDQYSRKGFARVQVKGGAVGSSCHCIGTRAKSSMTGWRRARMRPLPFITRTGRRLSRREAAAIIQRMAAQANGRLSNEKK